ncbi:hypothetical protein T07_9247 [Trichinella nelsoni]|uniref:Uncharacterized protein n=1 Tax=Trichinella nelsoni TaxID=6336 RepID=A0A0V0RUA9_9BILA|nr:hypothetical protein T07_9247 [Trichinella nelsoni]
MIAVVCNTTYVHVVYIGIVHKHENSVKRFVSRKASCNVHMLLLRAKISNFHHNFTPNLLPSLDDK